MAGRNRRRTSATAESPSTSRKAIVTILSPVPGTQPPSEILRDSGKTEKSTSLGSPAFRRFNRRKVGDPRVVDFFVHYDSRGSPNVVGFPARETRS